MATLSTRPAPARRKSRPPLPGADDPGLVPVHGAARQPPAAGTTFLPGGPGETAEKPAKTLEELLAELDALVGLNRVKAEIRQQTQLLRVERLRTEAGLTAPTLTRHLVFLGNPGTGKTTVARLVAGIYRALGLLSKGHLVEVDRSELVAGYLGQTAVKTSEVVAARAMRRSYTYIGILSKGVTIRPWSAQCTIAAGGRARRRSTAQSTS